MNLDALIGYADILASESDGGEVRSNLGDSITGEGIDKDLAHWGVDGFLSRPNDPDEDGAAQALFIVEGQEKRVIGTRDVRWAAKAGNLDPGDRAIVSNCAARVFLKQKSSSVAIYTEGPDGKPLLFEVNGKKGNATLVACSDGGTALLQMKPGEIILGVDGGGSIVIDKGGVHVFGPHFAANTAGGNLGVVGAVAPPPGANSILMGVSGMAGVPNPKWTIGA